MLKTRMDLNKDVLDELAFDPSVDEREIGVAVSDGVVTLSGTVKNYAQKLAAEKAVRRVSGVHGIAESLIIELPLFHRRDDVDLANSALNALRWNASLPPDSIFVKVENGWITLAGTVEWQYQREAARLAVASLAGVRGVSSDVVLRQRVVASDVRTKIRASFKRVAESDANSIDVEAHDGTVTLRGAVHSFAERDDAVTAAYSIAGVEIVRNLTTIA